MMLVTDGRTGEICSGMMLVTDGRTGEICSGMMLVGDGRNRIGLIIVIRIQTL
jgi:hypothetical protein